MLLYKAEHLTESMKPTNNRQMNGLFQFINLKIGIDDQGLRFNFRFQILNNFGNTEVSSIRIWCNANYFCELWTWNSQLNLQRNWGNHLWILKSIGKYHECGYSNHARIAFYHELTEGHEWLFWVDIEYQKTSFW